MPVNIFYYKGTEVPGKATGIPDSIFSGLRMGLLEGRVVTLSYTNAESEDSRRNVLPEAVYRWKEDWYLSAWCYLREEKRTFRIDRIREVVLTDRQDDSHGIADEIMKNGLPWEPLPPEKRNPLPVPETQKKNSEPDPLAEYSHFLKPDGSVKTKAIAEWSFTRNTLSVNMTNSHLPYIVRRLLSEKVVRNGKPDSRTKLLFVASALLDSDCMRKCLKAGANPDFRYLGIYTPVKIAANSYAEFASGLFLKAIRILHKNGAGIASDPLVRNIAAVTKNIPLSSFLEKIGVKPRKYVRPVKEETPTSGLYTRIQFRTGDKGREVVISSSSGGGYPPDPDRFSRELVRDSGNGNLESVLEDLVGGADVNFIGGDGRAALHSAARFGFFEICRLLIEKGADVTLRDGCGDTVLTSAARSGNLELIQYLLEENGCDIQARNRFGWTPLYCSVLDNHPEVMRYLMEKGADIHTLTQDRESLLMSAAGFSFASPEEKLETARFLLGIGVDPNLHDKNGETALFRAVEKDFAEMAELLLKNGAKASQDNKKGKTPLHVAVAAKREKIARMLLAYRADPNVGDANGFTPMMYPTVSLEMLRFFIQSGANVNAVTETGKNVLMCHAAPYQTAREYGLATYGLGLSRPVVMKRIDFLLECGADPAAHDIHGNSAAMLSVDQYEIALHLLKKSRLPLNETNRKGETMLIRAVKAMNLDLVRYLLRRHARKSVRDLSGKTALDHAWNMLSSGRSHEATDMISLLEP